MKRLKNLIELAMVVLQPTRGNIPMILDTMRLSLGVDLKAKPVWKEYLVQQRGTSTNKHHYFAVFQRDDKKFVAANAHGRIGYQPQVSTIAISDAKNTAITAATKKIKRKIAQGYRQQKL